MPAAPTAEEPARARPQGAPGAPDAEPTEPPVEPGQGDARGSHVGSVADEATRLLGALLDRAAATPAGGPAPGASGPPAPQSQASRDAAAGTPASPHADAHPDGGCSRCPLCTAARTVRGLGPEHVEAVADVLSLGAKGLRSIARRLRETPPATPQPPTPPPSGGGEATTTPQHPAAAQGPS